MAAITLKPVFLRQRKTESIAGLYRYHLCFHSLFQSSLTINYFQASAAVMSKKNIVQLLSETLPVWKKFHFGHWGFYISRWSLMLFFTFFQEKLWNNSSTSALSLCLVGCIKFSASPAAPCPFLLASFYMGLFKPFVLTPNRNECRSAMRGRLVSVHESCN